MDASARRPGEPLTAHRRWRPEWTAGRVCLCWYAVVGDELLAVLESGGLRTARQAVRRAGWLDTVPTRWLHITLGVVGFADELRPPEVQAVLAAGRACATRTPRVRVGFGEAAPMEDAVALPVEPLDALQDLQLRLHTVTREALGVDESPAASPLYPPHLSLGYVRRPTSAEEVAELLDRVDEVSGRVTLDRVVLAAVTRRRTHYEWDVVAELPLAAPAL